MARTRRHQDRSHSTPAFARALGRTIKVIRTDIGIDRRTLAREAGISYSYLTEIENGNKPPSASVLGPIASALGMRMSRLIQEAEDRLEMEESAEPGQERQTLWARSPLWEDEIPGSSPQSSPPQPAAPYWEGETEQAPAVLDRFELQLRSSPSRQYAMRPGFRGPNRRLRSALMELEALLPSLSAEDVERLLDLARRLAR